MDIEFIKNYHELYHRYHDSWVLNHKSYIGGPEYRDGHYLRMYAVDTETPSEMIKTYDIDSHGRTTASYNSRINYSHDGKSHDRGTSDYEGTFYYEKLHNTALYPYVRLYVSEYNSILYNRMPYRVCGDTPEMYQFKMDCDGEGNSLNEFWSSVDIMTTVFGITWVSCIKHAGADYASLQYHTPLDVVNWRYGYSGSGKKILKEIVIMLSDNSDHTVYRYISENNITTVWVGDKLPEIDNDNVIYESGFAYVQELNELGYVPVTPIYQGTKIYTGVGHTPIFDIAQIQRSIYGDMAEIYSAITYGAHPVLLADEDTVELNGGVVGAEPGAVIRVRKGISGDQDYVYEFVAPSIDSIDSIKDLVDHKIEKMNSVAMVRGDELIRSSRSGVQIEQFDSKLESFIRRKATMMENAEQKVMKMWFDWQDQPLPEDFKIVYSKVYGKRSLEHELNDVKNMMSVYQMASEFMGSDAEIYDTRQQAENRATELGGSGSHEHVLADGSVKYMPFQDHEQYQLYFDIGDFADYQKMILQRFEEILNQNLNSSND